MTVADGHLLTTLEIESIMQYTMTKPTFVDIDLYPVGPGDFVVKRYGSRGKQVARIHHWINENRARGYVYSMSGGRWSGLVTIERSTIMSKILRAGDLAMVICSAPKVEL